MLGFAAPPGVSMRSSCPANLSRATSRGTCVYPSIDLSISQCDMRGRVRHDQRGMTGFMHRE